MKSLRVVLCFLAAAALSGQDSKDELQARKAMDEFMTAFNSRDPQARAATLNYSHVRFARNEVRGIHAGDPERAR
jgi:hypothetical protein